MKKRGILTSAGDATNGGGPNSIRLAGPSRGANVSGIAVGLVGGGSRGLWPAGISGHIIGWAEETAGTVGATL